MRVREALLVVLTLVGRAPVAAIAESSRFEEPRARSLLAGLMADQAPHPIGSSENLRVRERIERRLAELGYATTVQRRFVCGELRRTCGTVENVLARREGRVADEAILLNTHYDTQPATPGAADPMAGVAVALEVARLVAAEPPRRRGIIFLFNDGEEAGLLGSTAFVRHHPWARDVVAVINLDARGSRGKSFLAATIGGDRAIVDAWAKGWRWRHGSSLVPALVGLLSNSNDLAAFDALGVPGALFGFADGARSYHSAADTLERLAPESLQGMGDDAFDVARQLAAAARIERADEATTYFAAGPWVPRWPSNWNLGLLLIGGALVASLAALGIRRGELSGSEIAWGAGSCVLAAFAGGAGALGTEKARQLLLGDGPTLVAHPGPAAAAMLLGATAGALAVVVVLRRRAGRWGQPLAVLGAIFAGGLVAQAALPGAVFLFVSPLLAATAFGLGRRWLGAAVVAVTTLGLWLSAIGEFRILFGLAASIPIGAVLGMLSGILGPLLPAQKGRWLAPATAAAASLAALVVVARQPVFSAEQPQFQNLLYVSRPGSGTASWLATGWPIPESWRARLDFVDEEESGLHWSRIDSGTAATAPVVELPHARLEIVASDADGATRRVRGRLVPSGSIRLLEIVVADGSRLREISVDGVTVPAERLLRYRIHREGYEVIRLWSPPASGSDLELAIEGEAPLPIELVERTEGLPAMADPLLDERPAWSQPNGFGDATIVRWPIEI